jgi:hypothetical protein
VPFILLTWSNIKLGENMCQVSIIFFIKIYKNRILNFFFEKKIKITFETDWKYVFKPIFWLEKLMKLICNKLGNEDQHMFQSFINKNLFIFCKNLFESNCPHWKVDIKSYLNFEKPT